MPKRDKPPGDRAGEPAEFEQGPETAPEEAAELEPAQLTHDEMMAIYRQDPSIAGFDREDGQDDKAYFAAFLEDLKHRHGMTGDELGLKIWNDVMPYGRERAAEEADAERTKAVTEHVAKLTPDERAAIVEVASRPQKPHQGLVPPRAGDPAYVVTGPFFSPAELDATLRRILLDTHDVPGDIYRDVYHEVMRQSREGE